MTGRSSLLFEIDRSFFFGLIVPSFYDPSLVDRYFRTLLFCCILDSDLLVISSLPHPMNSDPMVALSVLVAHIVTSRFGLLR
jgi:hypothetical protein